jgi:hypothetical protein
MYGSSLEHKLQQQESDFRPPGSCLGITDMAADRDAMARADCHIRIPI